MATGRIVRLVKDRKFGFIAADGPPSSGIFFHVTGLQGVTFDELQEGDVVAYEAVDTPKGLRASSVSRVPRVWESEE